MEQLNYHKLLNLKKRFDKFDCESSSKILTVINECIIIEKEKSKIRDKQRRDDYMYEDVICDICGKKMLRNNLYKHKNNIH